MILSVKERLIILNILPDAESYANMLILQDLKGELGFSEADHARLGLVEKDGDVTWDDGNEAPKDVSVGLVAFDLIRAAFKKMDAEKAISGDLLPLYRRFVIDEAEVETVEEASA